MIRKIIVWAMVAIALGVGGCAGSPLRGIDIGIVGDGLSTVYAMRDGAVEANPLMRGLGDPVAIAVGSIAVSYAGLYGVRYFSPASCIGFHRVLNTGKWGVVVNNIAVASTSSTSIPVAVGLIIAVLVYQSEWALDAADKFCRYQK